MGKQPKKPTPGVETAEVHAAFEEETGQLLRRRILFVVATWGVFSLVEIAFRAVREYGIVDFGDADDAKRWTGPQHAAFWAAIAIWIVGYGAIALGVSPRKDAPPRLMRAASEALGVLDGVKTVIWIMAGVVNPWAIAAFLVPHLYMSIVFPWSLKQALRVGAIVIGAAGAVILYERGSETGVRLWVAAMPILIAPGAIICWRRHTRRLERFSYNFMSRRYGDLRQELAYARSVHESLFPQPHATGPVRFAYRYEPMRQIGGDFLHVATTGDPDNGNYSLSLVLLDVTGHGIPAALTVNRLHGEIELNFADNPGIGPADVLKRLNRYVSLTLAQHSLFATALCVRIDPNRGVIEHASAGHPPAFLIASDGSVEDLGPTGIVLGASDDEAFMPRAESRSFGPHDALIAYTDGVTEARSIEGRMLRIDGLRAMVQAQAKSPPGGRSLKLLEQVAIHRGHKPPEDDTLLVEVFRAGEVSTSRP